MTSLDLVNQVANDLVARDADTGEPVAVRFPGGGDIALTDLDGLALWLRTVIDLEREGLGPVKRLVQEHLTELLDAQAEASGTYTVHTRDGLEVSVESRGTHAAATKVDAVGLYADIVVLRRRAGATLEEAFQQADAYFKVERELTASGRKKLEALGGPYAEALEEHTAPAERTRKAPSVRRAS